MRSHAYFAGMKVKLSHLVVAAAVAFAGLYALRATGSHGHSAAASACKPGDFALKDLAASRHFTQASLNGTIVSRCSEPAIVHLRWIVQNADGTTSSFPFYVHDGAPIGPNEAYLFAVNEETPPGKSHWRLVIDGITAG